MYYRIKNKLDAEMLVRNLLRYSSFEARERLTERIRGIADTLDTVYGGERSAISYGGYILFFPTQEIYQESIKDILNYYHLCETESEYTDIIYVNKETEWCEELFLLSSEDSLTLLYPRKKYAQCIL